MNQDLPGEDGALVFVYNANAGWQQAFWDTLHKYMRPETYGCNLCRVTHGPIGPKAAWKAFLRDCGRPVVFLHRDEFRELPREQATAVPELPAVYTLKGGSAAVLLGAREINACQDLDDLLKTLSLALERS